MIENTDSTTERDYIKTVFAAVFTIYFFRCAHNPAEAMFLHNVNLPIHETGHLLFRPFGEFVMIAGGSLFQIIVPLVFCGYFIYNEKPFSASMVLFWVGESLCDVYVYAADAQVMQLLLTSGMTGSEGGFHDWNYLLTAMNSLNNTKPIANLIRFIGVVLMIFATIGSLLYATKNERIFTDIE
ncbi:MAG: hypothetical protein H7Z37_08375 [Pyrinomonadaceae bacterium]|nr:hypothetical protein [Pyrinomonadaceae bacterium]